MSNIWKNMSTITIVVLIFLICSSFTFASETILSFDHVNGTVTVDNLEEGFKHKLVVQHNNGEVIYNVENGSVVPLQMGDGDYQLNVFRNIEGTKYMQLYTESVTLDMKDDLNVYLNSIDFIDYEKSKIMSQVSKDIMKGNMTDEEKIIAVHDYVISSIEYDYAKAANVTKRYNSNLDYTLESGKAICYDYASLVAGFLRNQGIPTKVVFGNSSNSDSFHAWNEVYIDGEWQVLDTTYDAEKYQKGYTIESIYQDASDYQSEEVY